MIASTKKAAWKALPRSQYHFESHGDKCCIYLVKTKGTLLLEGLDAEAFSFLEQHSDCRLSDLVEHITVDPKISNYSVDSSLQKLTELGLIQTAMS